jgi:hypothetical protein
MVEFAVVVLVFVTLVLGMLDLGYGVFQYHIVAEAARQGARQAIVHGGLADRLGPWGPASYSGAGSDTHPLAEAVRPYLVGLDPNEVTIEAVWLDGGNGLDERVQITVGTPFRPIMTFIFNDPAFNLEATSTMRIAH